MVQRLELHGLPLDVYFTLQAVLEMKNSSQGVIISSAMSWAQQLQQ